MDKTKIHKMWIADQGDGTYINPILYTDYSDPDAIRVGRSEEHTSELQSR